MKNLTILIILFTIINLSAKDKYYVYFKDKGIQSNAKLSKTSAEYLKAYEILSTRSIERRLKIMGEDNLITFEDLPLNTKYVNQIESLGIEIHHKLKWFNAVTAYLTTDEIKKIENFDFIERIEKVKTLTEKNSTINLIEKDKDFQLLGKSQNTYSLDYGNSYTQLELSDIPKVHELGISGESVLIGLLDSGFNWEVHESLIPSKVIADSDFVFKDGVVANEPNDVPGQHNHGTYVFSIVGGYKPGNIIGVSYNAEFILAKTEDIGSERRVEEDNYAAAMEWMEAQGVDITSSSLGYSTFDNSEENYSYQDMNGNTTIVTKACELAFQRGVIVFTSGGNEGNNTWYYITAPADGFNTIAVGAATSSNSVASFSGRGPTYDGRIKPDILTMGVGVYGASGLSSNLYNSSNGTSAACPIASGIAGLAISVFPHLDNVQLRNIILQSGDNPNSPNNERGYGLLSALRVITYPNIYHNTAGNRFELNKIFYNDNGVNYNTSVVKITKDFNNYDTYSMQFDGDKKTSIELPQYNLGDQLYIYFNYQDGNGVQYREPEVGHYKIVYGSKNIISGIESNEDNSIPSDFYLYNAYPNPFNLSSTIQYYSKEVKNVRINIYNTLGQKVRTLFSGNSVSGFNRVLWNGENDDNEVCSSGVYFVYLESDNALLSNKLVLLK